MGAGNNAEGNNEMTPTGRVKREFHPPIHNLKPRMMGVDFASKPDMVAVAVGGTIMDRATINAKSASRKADREFIVNTLLGLMERHGAEVERRDDGPNPGYHGHSIALRFTLNGVGAMLDIDDLHGGEWSLIHWHNTEYPARNFTSRFCVCVGGVTSYRPHHKATSQPGTWYSLAMFLDAGLCLAARGEAFDEAGH
jgi:hypothetical protein